MNKPNTKSVNKNVHQKADLLIEIGCEELPPKSLPLLGNTLLQEFSVQLEKSQLAFDAQNSRSFYTPRRLALLMGRVASRQADQFIERKGPAMSAAFDANNQPTPAANGFARSVGKRVEELETLKTGKGEWLYCRVEKSGERLEDLLFPMLERALGALQVARPMRWAANDFSFIRPVHWLVTLYGSRVIPGKLFGLDAGHSTRGHRVHSPGPHKIESANHYEKQLELAFVVADQAKRRELIRQQAVNLGENAGGETLVDDKLLEEVSNLVEWPRSICGSFDMDFLDVPAEALIASMQDHQKFFPVVSTDLKVLMARFIAVANLESRDFDTVREGFEKVIRPRLADARFFWEQDNKSPIHAWLPVLDSIVFQDRLGSVGDKSKRIAAISMKIADYTNVNKSAVERAAMLCKCDLVSQMVGEFPELQGIMGRYYAEKSGEDSDVSRAIGEHYLPAYSGDQLPGHAVGKVVALADKVDSLTGIFATGLKPTGNKDPFALRRAALGVVRILLDGELVIELDKLLAIGAMAVQVQLPVPPEVLLDLRKFILERLRHHLREQNYDTGLVNAALDAPLNTLPDLLNRLSALREFMRHEAASSLVAANKRIGNILRKSDSESNGKINENILIIKEEKHLFEEVNNISSKLDQLCIGGDYASALSILGGLSGQIEAFFDNVMVMDDDANIRNNRLSLLAKLKGLFDRIANLALIG